MIFALSALSMAAQNNPYEIDDECYGFFVEAERLLGQPGFENANLQLLDAAQAKGDTKAETLYYVERLKSLTRYYRSRRETGEEDDARVQEYMEDLKSVAGKYGYKQYFYYAYELAQNYYYNHGKYVRTMELVEDLQRVALAQNDEYGHWIAARYMVSLYIEQNDYVSAKKYIKRALNIYLTTDDPTIKRQSPTRLYCDMSDTYPIGHDSVRINIAKAGEACLQHMDTLRWRYHVAKLSAFYRDIPTYEKARDYCLSDPQLTLSVSPTAVNFFKNIDAIVYGQGMDNVQVEMVRLREVKYLANIAEEYGYKDEAFAIEKKLVAFEENTLSTLNQSKISELEARMGNDRLHADLDRTQAQVTRIYGYLAVAVSLILATILAFLIVHLTSLRRKNRELLEANHKVMLANAAKTRFVQNMSHEVRTPLNAIVGFSQLLSLPDGTFSPEEKEEFSSHIVNNTKMLTMLLDDILNTSAMDNGTYNIHYEAGECNFMCKAAISSAEHRLQPGVTMSYNCVLAGPHTFITDPRRVQQILINLLTNACKHTSQGSIVLSCSLDENPGEVTFSVTDTGPGVPADQAEKIFDRFTKLNEFVQGTGLGLSICRDIAERMDGRVYFDTSYSGTGARFVFVVPDKQILDTPVINPDNIQM